MNQFTFNLDEALIMRDRGMHLVAENNEEFLTVARNLARRIAMKQGTVTSDDIRKRCWLKPSHPNAWGTVIRGNEWEWTGEYRTSTIVSRHAGIQKVWRLRG